MLCNLLVHILTFFFSREKHKHTFIWQEAESEIFNHDCQDHYLLKYGALYLSGCFLILAAFLPDSLWPWKWSQFLPPTHPKLLLNYWKHISEDRTFKTLFYALQAWVKTPHSGLQLQRRTTMLHANSLHVRVRSQQLPVLKHGHHSCHFSLIITQCLKTFTFEECRDSFMPLFNDIPYLSFPKCTKKQSISILRIMAMKLIYYTEQHIQECLLLGVTVHKISNISQHSNIRVNASSTWTCIIKYTEDLHIHTLKQPFHGLSNVSTYSQGIRLPLHYITEQKSM